MRKSLLIVGSLFLLTMLASVAHAADMRKILRVQLGDITSLDPQQGTDLASTRVASAIFEALYQFDYFAEPATVIPCTAEALPAITNGGKTWTMWGRSPIDTNPSQFKQAEYDAAYEQFLRTPAGPARTALARKMSDVSQAYMPMLLHTYGVGNAVLYPWVLGYWPSQFGFSWKYLDLDPAKKKNLPR